METIAILLPVHNGEKYIKECILSILNQTYKNFVLLIRANACTDNTISVVANIYKEHPLREKIYLSSTPEKGKCKALNYMLNVLTREQYSFVSLIDADDKWEPTKLEEQVKYMQTYDVIGTKCIYISENDNVLSIRNPLPNTHEEIVQYIKKEVNPIINSSVLIRKKFLKSFDGWDALFEGVEDFYLWAQMAIFSFAKFINVDKPLVLHRIHTGSHFNAKDQSNKLIQIHQFIKENTNENTRAIK